MHQHTLRTHLADHSRQRTPQLHVVFDAAIGHAKEDERLDTYLFARTALLFATHQRHLRTGDCLIEPAGVAIGDEAVGDLNACIGHVRYGPRSAEVDIVGVGGDHQRPLYLMRFQHALNTTAD